MKKIFHFLYFQKWFSTIPCNLYIILLTNKSPFFLFSNTIDLLSVQHTPKGDCGVELKFHSKYHESERDINRVKFICPLANRPDFCQKKNCYRYQNFSDHNFRMLLIRNSDFFKRNYSKRSLIKSLFSRLESILSHTKLRFTNSIALEANLINLFFIASAFLAHDMGRDDLLTSIKSTRSNFVRR
ncbi:hypothetical protein XO12_10715 [Marinitoga sp. 1154]|uniref:hypothetical protein n=1 Tax=Marinitoga sp. 1154 TaxID=1643335 RepID=UPI001586DAFA|nr:hypothetical protein [Marinitoga sp. 1154]NUV00531.1 hypothetical protein [Marinitoga sp. 1154]